MATFHRVFCLVTLFVAVTMIVSSSEYLGNPHHHHHHDQLMVMRRQPNGEKLVETRSNLTTAGWNRLQGNEGPKQQIPLSDCWDHMLNGLNALIPMDEFQVHAEPLFPEEYPAEATIRFSNGIAKGLRPMHNPFQDAVVEYDEFNGVRRAEFMVTLVPASDYLTATIHANLDTPEASWFADPKYSERIVALGYEGYLAEDGAYDWQGVGFWYDCCYYEVDLTEMQLPPAAEQEVTLWIRNEAVGGLFDWMVDILFGDYFRSLVEKERDENPNGICSALFNFP